MFSPQNARPQDANPKHSAQTRPVSPAERSLPIRIYPHGLLLLSPLIIVVAVAILLGLLGIFVTWLLIVAALVSAIVASDLARRSLRRFLKANGQALQHRTAGYR